MFNFFHWLAYIKYKCFLQEFEMACVFAIKISIYIVCPPTFIYGPDLASLHKTFYCTVSAPFLYRFTQSYCKEAKSLYRSCAGNHFYRTEKEIWAGFGPFDNTEKRFHLP